MPDVSVTFDNRTQTAFDRFGDYAAWNTQPPQPLPAKTAAVALFTYNEGTAITRTTFYFVPGPPGDPFSFIIDVDANGFLSAQANAPAGFSSGAITGNNKVDFIIVTQQ